MTRVVPRLVLIACALPCALRLSAAGWPTKGHDVRRTGQSEVSGPRPPMRVTAAELHDGVAVNIAPSVSGDGRVFVGTWGIVRSYGLTDRSRWTKADGGFFAFDAMLRPLWSFAGDAVPYCYSYAGRATPLWCPGGGTLNGYNGTVEGTAALDEGRGRVYVGRGDGKIYALDATTGALLWRFTTFNPLDPSDPEGGGEVIAGPLIAEDGIIYAVTVGLGSYETNAIYAISPDGQLLWRYPATARSAPTTFWAAPALSPDGRTLYVPGAWGPTGGEIAPDSRGAVYAFDVARATGTGDERLKWKFEPVNESLASSPAVWVTTLSVGSDGTIYATGTEAGSNGSAVLFSLRDNGSGAAYGWSRMVDLDRGSAKTSLGLALRETNGRTARVYATSGNVYVTLFSAYPRGGKLHAVDPASGTPLWARPFDPEEHGGAGSMSGIAIGADGVVYTAVSGLQSGGRMYAIAEDGSLLWDVAAGGLIEWGHPVIGPSGEVYFADTRRCPWSFQPVESGGCAGFDIAPSLYLVSPARRRAIRR